MSPANNPIRPSQSHEESGSDPSRSVPDYLVIGQIIKPHGIRGEVSVKVLTDFGERFDEMESVHLGDDSSVEVYKIETSRWNRDRVLLRFAAINDRERAESLRGLYLKIPITEAMPLEPESFYHYQLEGLRVVTDQGEFLGHISQILETGANDVYIVEGEAAPILLPATHEVVLDINLDQQEMTVHLLDGLI